MNWEHAPKFEVSGATLLKSLGDIQDSIRGDRALHQSCPENITVTITSAFKPDSYFRIGVSPVENSKNWEGRIWYGSNGFIYDQTGKKLGHKLKMPAVTGDKVTVHWDPRIGSVSFSVNGALIDIHVPVKGSEKHFLFASARSDVMLQLTAKRKRVRDADDPEHFAAKRAKEQLVSGLFSDATVRCSDRSWSVHRSCLASASSVLRRMLESPMVEGSTASINITECQPETVAEFLEYIYTGSAPVLRSADINSEQGELLISLLEQAQVYDIGSLSEACWERLMEKRTNVINASNVGRLARLARTGPNSDDAVTSLAHFVNGNVQLLEVLIRNS